MVEKNKDLLNLAEEIKEREAHDEFLNAKNMNIELLKYAMELVDKEEEKEKKRIEREKKQLAHKEGGGGILNGVFVGEK